MAWRLERGGKAETRVCMLCWLCERRGVGGSVNEWQARQCVNAGECVRHVTPGLLLLRVEFGTC